MQGTDNMPWERIATLEQQMKDAGEDLTEIQSDLRTIKTEVQQINSKMDRQKGFFAGAAFVIGLFWAGVASLVAVFWQKIAGVFWP